MARPMKQVFKKRRQQMETEAEGIASRRENGKERIMTMVRGVV
jgi:hypothetical protein